MPLLALEKVTKAYLGGPAVLSGLDFSINRGEVIAIIGPSGSGKSTFLKISGLVDLPDKGKVVFDEHDCSHLPEYKQTILRRKNLGFIYQQHCLLPEFSTLENLIIPQLLCGTSKDEAEKKALLLLESLDLVGKAHSRPHQLSGGEQQRVAILRGIINTPQLLLADEPTGNLDPHNSKKVVDILLALVRNMGLAVIIVTHNLAVAARADRIMELRDGTLRIYTLPLRKPRLAPLKTTT